MKSSGIFGLWNAIGSGRKHRDYDTSNLPPEIQAYLSQLSDSELESLENDYYVKDNGAANAWGMGGYDREVLDTERLLKDLSGLSDINKEFDALGDAPVYEDYLNSARQEASDMYGGMIGELQSLADTRTNQFNEDMSNLQNDYKSARSGLITRQYQQNAQTMDTLQSGMDRTRRNALEAGASAGIRIAGNVNTLLSAQNKQAATSMDTANQLSQMMINQRNAESGLRSNYNDYMTQNTSQRQGLQREQDSYARGLAQTNFDAASSSYNSKEAAIKNKYELDNPLYDRRGAVKQASTQTNTR
jgi:hypothetical protein